MCFHVACFALFFAIPLTLHEGLTEKAEYKKMKREKRTGHSQPKHGVTKYEFHAYSGHDYIDYHDPPIKESRLEQQGLPVHGLKDITDGPSSNSSSPAHTPLPTPPSSPELKATKANKHFAKWGRKQDYAEAQHQIAHPHVS